MHTSGVQRGQSYLIGRRCLFSQPSSDGITIKIPYRVDDQPRTPSCPTGLFKTESDFTARSVETSLGSIVVAVTCDAYPFLAFSDLTCPCHLKDTGIGVFWLHYAT